MMPQPFAIKAALHATPAKTGATLLVTPLMVPVDDGKATVFGLCAIVDARPEVTEIITQILRGHLEQAAQSMGGETNIPRRFEIVLAEVNASLAEAASEFALKLNNFEAVVGVLTGTQLFISGLGNLLAIFLHQTTDRRFVIYELNEQFRTDTEATWDKPFITVLDGELQPGDIFYVATRTPNGSIAQGELQDILITLPPQGALERIVQFLPHEQQYGALCFHVASDVKSGAPRMMDPIASLTELGLTKSNTADLLGEQSTNISGAIKRFANSLTAELASPGARGYKAMAKRTLRTVVQILAALAVGIVEGGKLLGKLVIKIAQRLRRQDDTGEFQLKQKILQPVNKFRALPQSSKMLIFGILAVVVVLTGSVLFMTRAGANKKHEEIFAAAASAVAEKTTAAEASLIYNDTNQARNLLTEAATLLETLPADSRSHQDKINKLQTGLTEALGKIRHIAIVTPTTVAALPDGTKLSTISLAGTTLYGISASNQLFRINELNNTAEDQSATVGTIGQIVKAASEGNNLLLIDANRQLGRADVTAKSLNPISSGTTGMASVEDIALYNDALYVLSASSQQIVKMRAQGTNYEGGTAWISDRASDLTSAKALAIDGDLWVLTDKDVVRFKSGREVPWVHDALDPTLSQAIDVWTSLESPYLYILTKDEGGRIIVYNKETGKLVTQYKTPELANAVGFVVREAEKQIMFATPTSIWSFAATHLLK
jgi:hypothetical protein